MKIGIVQFNAEWENKEVNKVKITEITNNLSEKTNLLIFPEMTLTGFSMNSSEIKEKLEGESFLFFSDIAIKLNTEIIFGMVSFHSNKIFNSAVHISSLGVIKAVYNKIHPFSYAKENYYYYSGELPVVTNINNFSAGLSVCYDLRFPELYRIYGKQKTELIINIANWPINRINHWNLLLKARAIENQCFMIGVNRVGNDPFNNYTGSSAIYDPTGKEIINLKEEESISITEIDLISVKETRERFGFLEDIKLI